MDERVPYLTRETRVRGDALNLCNPILDIEDGPGGYVSFSHFTAIESEPQLPESLAYFAKFVQISS